MNDIIRGRRGDEFDEDLAALRSQFPEEIVQAIQLGIEAEAFMTKSKVGVYLYNRALSEITDATQDLSRMRDIRSREAEEAHDRLRIAQLFLDWINDALEHGARAEELAMEAEHEQEGIEAEHQIEQA